MPVVPVIQRGTVYASDAQGASSTLSFFKYTAIYKAAWNAGKHLRDKNRRRKSAFVTTS